MHTPKKQRQKKPSPRQLIAAAHAALLPQLPNLPADGALTHCWACGVDTDGGQDLAHIQADVNGGSRDPENFWLLCERCHAEQPDGASKAVQILWLKTREPFKVYLDRRMAQLTQMLRLVAAEEGRDYDAWYLEFSLTVYGHQWLPQIASWGASRTAGPSLRNTMANEDAAFAEAFRAFLRNETDGWFYPWEPGFAPS